MRSCPLYHAGSVGVNITSGEPKVGQLVEAAWNLGERCRFRLLPLGLKDTHHSDEGTDYNKVAMGGSEYLLVAEGIVVYLISFSPSISDFVNL